MKKLIIAAVVSLVAVVVQARMDFGKIKSGSGSAADNSQSKSENSSASSAKSENEPDSRVIRALKKEELKYEVANDGDVCVSWNVSEEGEAKRTHVVCINSGTQEFGGLEIREVWGVAYRGPRLPRNTLAGFMLDNGQKKLGSWQLIEDKGGEALIYCCQIPANCDSKLLGKTSQIVATIADAVEKDLDGEDNF